MQVEIITIGDEILIGQIVDTNSAWMAQQLNLLGFSVKQISSVSDNETHILKALNDLLKLSRETNSNFEELLSKEVFIGL
jgi:nicotinamide-nucleotide amidase